MSEPTKYAEFVMPELSKSRLDAQWTRISEQKSERKRWNAAIPAVGILVAACALAVVWWPRDARNTGESVGAGSVVASDDAPVEMTLAEGTRIQVEPRSEVKLLQSSSRAVKVRLGHGSARFEVSKKRSRRFSVDLGKVEVVVTGTQFRVLRKAGPHGDRVQVSVEEGSVEVHRENDSLVTLHAGEDWSAVVAGDAVAQQPAPQTEPTPERLAPTDGDEVERDMNETDTNELEPSDLATEAQGEDGAVDRETFEQDEIDSADSEAQRRHAQRERRRRRAREAAADAGELLDHANLARRAGRLEDAAELYAALVARYPSDRRASLAAFELGRLRMDSLRDMRGAVQALERALKLDARGTFAEDALARLVLAEEARGDRHACSRARGRYLARYPEGVHAQHVAERCGGN